ncbi:unnamed protein product, partial [Didymodactylos carnosus]
SYDIFHHESIKNKYDYLMRLDSDSYFNDYLSDDLFKIIYNQDLHYVYRSLYTDHGSSKQLNIIEQDFFYHNDEQKQVNISYDKCIYNNFFIISLKFWHNDIIIQTLLKQLIPTNLMIESYIGDGCVHASMIRLGSNKEKTKQLLFPYGHNMHFHEKNVENYTFIENINYFDAISDNVCQKFVFIDINKNLKIINV